MDNRTVSINQFQRLRQRALGYKLIAKKRGDALRRANKLHYKAKVIALCLIILDVAASFYLLVLR